MTEKNIKSRIVHKHDTEAHWDLAENFTPKQGEIIVYDIDDNYNYERFKIGDGVTLVNELPFADESIIVESTRVTHNDYLLSNIIDVHILNIDYETLLAFDTSEIVTGATSTTSVLGQAVLGQMVLA
jgi:hypothetical protein